MIISNAQYYEDVVIIDCQNVTGYSNMCNRAWKTDLGRWFLPKSVFHKYHEITGYNQRVRDYLLSHSTENKE